MAVNEHPGVLQYSRVRKSPYFYSSRKHGVALYSFYNHTYHPRHYGDPVAEYYHLLEGVTLWDVGVEKQIEISGPDAFAFTQLLVARDLNKCAVEQCKYVFLCLPDGGIINDPVLLRVEENRFWLSLADSDVELWARGVAYNGGYDVEVKELDVGPVQVQGPKSKDVLVDLFGDSILDIPYYYMRPYELDGMRMLVSRTGYTAELGYEIYLYDAYRDGDKLWAAVLEAGKPRTASRSSARATSAASRAASSPSVVTCGTTRTRTRSAWATRGWSTSSRRRTSSARTRSRQDQGRGSQADARRRRDRRPEPRLLQRRLDDRHAPRAPRRQRRSARSRRRATRRAWRRTSASRWCRSSCPSSGREFEVEAPSGRVEAIVVPKPFVDPDKDTPKQQVKAGAERPSDWIRTAACVTSAPPSVSRCSA